MIGFRVVLLTAAIVATSASPACSRAEQEPAREFRRIAFGSCAYQFEPQPILDTVVAARPDLFIYLGDAIYADWDGEQVVPVTPESLRTDWEKLADRPAFQRLRSSVPLLATWDNHDYGKHDGGAEFALKEESKRIFLDFFGEPAGSARRKRPGIHDAKVFGPEGRRVQIVLLDTRTFKGPFVRAERPEGTKGSLGKYAPNPDPAVTLLGDAQWRWLEEALEEPAEVRLIASSTQVIADEKGMDEWGNYPLERKRLFDLIAKTGATGVVLLSGNVHVTEISRTDEGPYPLLDFTSSGMTHVDPEYAEAKNSRRIAGPAAELNFGTVDIDWDARPGPAITLTAVGLDGEAYFEQGVLLSDLR